MNKKEQLEKLLGEYDDIPKRNIKFPIDAIAKATKAFKSFGVSIEGAIPKDIVQQWKDLVIDAKQKEDYKKLMLGDWPDTLPPFGDLDEK